MAGGGRLRPHEPLGKMIAAKDAFVPSGAGSFPGDPRSPGELAAPLKERSLLETLEEKYWRVFHEEGPLELEEFLEQIKEGKHGQITAEEIDDFLDDMLQTMLANIQLKATESPHFEAMRPEVEARTEERIRRLKARYGRG